VAVSTSSTPSNPSLLYDVVVISAGETPANGFLAAPQGGSQNTSPPGQLQIANPRILFTPPGASSPIDVTGQTTTVIIGEQITLTTGIDVTPASFSWGVPGSPVSGFNASGPSGSYPSLTSSTLQSASLQFYWTAPGSFTVTDKVSILGAPGPITVQATFTVMAPTATITAGTCCVTVDANSIAYGGSPALYFGQPHVYGITFSQTVQVPSGFSGSTAWLQLVTSSLGTRQPTTGSQQMRVIPACVDTNDASVYFYKPPTGTAPPTGDQPAELLPSSGFTAYSRADTFTMYLMFQPSNANSIYVPIRILPWYWSGMAAFSGGSWSLSGTPLFPANPADEAPPTPNPSANPINPAWSINCFVYYNSPPGQFR
jgi:hypothetical protein